MMLNFDFSGRINELKQRLHVLHQEKATISDEIEQIYRSTSDLPKTLGPTLAALSTKISVIESDASHVCTLMSVVSHLAESISVKVRELDLAKTRIVDCLQRIDDALDLRLCTEGIQVALNNEDYEQAAAHVHRFLTLESTAFDFNFKGEDSRDETGCEPSIEQVELMKKAERELNEIVSAKFDEAFEANDVASMERFFKLFPLLSQHDVGLRKYARRLKNQVKEVVARNAPSFKQQGSVGQKRATVIYADALTILLEEVARIFETNQPLIETYYGPDRLVDLAEILQEECDDGACNILDKFISGRSFYENAALVKKLLYGTKGLPSDKIDPLDLDIVLTEVTLIHTRAELYFGFLRRRITANSKSVDNEGPNRNGSNMEKFDKFLRGCRLSRRLQELLGQYVLLEEYYMRGSIDKAYRIDCREPGSLVSSAVDDVFFIIRKSIRRALSSSNVDCVCAMINNACAVLDTDYIDRLKQRLKNGYPTAGSFAEAYTTAAAAYASVLQQGKIGAASVDSGEKARDDFITALNNCEASTECIETLKATLSNDFNGCFVKLSDHDAEKLRSCLAQLDDVRKEFAFVLQSSLEQLFASAARPRLRSTVELFLDDTHAPNEAEFADLEASDAFVQQLVTVLDSVLNVFKELLNPAVYNSFVELAAGSVAVDLEKVILKATFNRLGGLVLDKQVRSLSAYWTTIASWCLREKFSRLSQIVSLLNVESVVDAESFYKSSSLAWLLSPAEIKQVLALRVDLPGNDIRQLAL